MVQEPLEEPGGRDHVGMLLTGFIQAHISATFLIYSRYTC